MKSKKKSVAVQPKTPVVSRKRKIAKRVGIAGGTLLALWLAYHLTRPKPTITRTHSMRMKPLLPSPNNVPGPSGLPTRRNRNIEEFEKYKKRVREQKKIANDILLQVYYWDRNRTKRVLEKGKWKKGNYENRTRHLLGTNYNKNNNVV